MRRGRDGHRDAGQDRRRSPSTAADPIHVAAPRPAEAVSERSSRQTVEFLVVLGLGILLFRTFAAEAYIVPTGSMAPTLLGHPQGASTCPNCRFPFVIGLDDQGRAGRPVCPNCGQDGLGTSPAVECNGDRLLVQKFLFDLRRPRRWEVAVFQSPAEPDQAYVKRVVGLPGEAIQICGGDVFIDGRIARKIAAEEQRAMRILVFDNNFVPADSDRFPRWAFRRGDRTGRTVAERLEGRRDPVRPRAHDGRRPTAIDWLDYRHWDPDRGRYGPVRDFIAYNGGDVRGENAVRDLMLEADVSARPDVPSPGRPDRLGRRPFVVVTLPVDGRRSARGPAQRQADRAENVREGGLASSPAGVAAVAAAGGVGVIDRRLTVALDGVPLFDPIDYDGPVGRGRAGRDARSRSGSRGGSMDAVAT